MNILYQNETELLQLKKEKQQSLILKIQFLFEDICKHFALEIKS